MEQRAQEDDIIIQDVEGYRNENLMFFSFEKLAMSALSRAAEAGSHEMRGGAMNTKRDISGNTVTTYIEDTRKKFIESVKSCKMIMVSEFDEECDNGVREIEEQIESKRKELLDSQNKWWKSQTPKFQGEWMVRGKGITNTGAFNPDLLWYVEFIEEEVGGYRAIFEELMKLAARKNYFKEEDFEA